MKVEFKRLTADWPTGCWKGLGHGVIESRQKIRPKSFFILFQNGTRLLRQFEKILPMVTFDFAKFARAEPVVLRACQPKT